VDDGLLENTQKKTISKVVTLGDIVRDGLIASVILFSVVALYIFTSSPFDDVMRAFENINNSTTDSRIETGATTGRTVYNIMFAIAGLVPICWFIVRVFQREPDWGFRP
jgi:hypothetical protein